jgi:hypothetical protein
MGTSYKVHAAYFAEWEWDDHIRVQETIARGWAKTMGVPWSRVEREITIEHDVVQDMGIRWVYYKTVVT